MKGVLFHQDNAPAHKSAIAMAAVRDCGFQLVDHPPNSPDLAKSIFCFPTLKTIVREASIEPMRSYLQLRTFFEDQDESFNLYHGNPSAATPMESEEVYGPQRRIF